MCCMGGDALIYGKCALCAGRQEIDLSPIVKADLCSVEVPEVMRSTLLSVLERWRIDSV